MFLCVRRRLHGVVAYFFFIFNVLVGFLSGIRRILFSLVLGTIFISRLDFVLFMRGLERFDTGITAVFIGLL